MANNYPKGFRQKIFKRDEFTCCLCAGKPSQIHHIHFGNLRKGRVHEEKECVSICRKCHNWSHSNKKKSIEIFEEYIKFRYTKDNNII